jgi:uncharacterized membrane protein YgdD (TMEM256/DUF423 family)
MSSARIVAVAGALAGFLGVMLSAVARHRPGTMYLEIVAQFLLFHASAFLGLAALLATRIVHPKAGAWAAGAVGLGLVLFCGDLAFRDFLGQPLFAMAAPTGGTILMAGWLLIGIAVLWRARA